MSDGGDAAIDLLGDLAKGRSRACEILEHCARRRATRSEA
jgi:hypothetical protein